MSICNAGMILFAGFGSCLGPNWLTTFTSRPSPELTQHIASCSCSSASRRPMHILLPIPKGTLAKGLMVLCSRSQRSGLNCFLSSKYSSLEPRAWLLIIRTVCKGQGQTIEYQLELNAGQLAKSWTLSSFANASLQYVRGFISGALLSDARQM